MPFFEAAEKRFENPFITADAENNSISHPPSVLSHMYLQLMRSRV